MRLWITILLFLVCHQASLAGTPQIVFPNACVKGQQLIIAAVGDLLLHTPLQIKSFNKGFLSLWEQALPYIKSADIAYVNLEGPIAEGVNRMGHESDDAIQHYDDNVYSGFPLFNYHPNLAISLRESNFTIASTANNHALDRHSIGVDKTIQALNQAGIAHVGSKMRGGTDQSWITILRKNDFTIAWLACTESINGSEDNYKQILLCYKKQDREWIINTVKHLKDKVDAIIISPHWGEEFQQRPNQAQINFAHQVLDAGATAVLGSHPHVLQPMEKYLTKDGRSTFIIYSLGNFVSYQGSPRNRATIILLMGLTKTDNATIINGIQFVPMYMQNRNGINEICLTKQQTEVVNNLLPVENILHSNKIVTNPECGT